ncbi:hypothetical protein BCR44DRAFT_1329630 [Catenaria anguillulae PL171]|uniref:Uncharacterized protein n=1 Tax=Catenaria anguillulae PL171 TaxID=765915 RepID=A0A1Y2H946_9FUNG|nr:hypothetical protein BCR44DRAFT_1329630 [Catenaria anguillulae PL171]
MTASNETQCINGRNSSCHNVRQITPLAARRPSTQVDPAALAQPASQSLAPAHALALVSRCHATHQPNLMLTIARQQ